MIEQQPRRPEPGATDKEKAESPGYPGGDTARPVEAVASISTGGGSTGNNEGERALPFSKARCIALVATVTGASFLNTLSAQAMVVILPTIGKELGIPESRLQWIISAYSLTFACFLLLWGRIADLFGKRIIFILGSAFMAATMIVNPFLPNEIAFDLFRGLQGMGAAANVPTAIGILGVTFPPGKAKNYAFSAYTAGAPLGAIFGNLLGGFIASYANWKWVFGACAGVAIAVTVAGLFFIPSPPPSEVMIRKQNVSLAHSVDWLGGFLITAGLLALLFALTEGNVVGWHTVWIYMLMVIALLLVGMFAAWQWYQEKHTARPPLMKVSIFRSGIFSTAILLMALFCAAFNDWMIFATFFYQDYQGLSPLQTSLRFLPTGIFGVVVAFVVSHLISKVSTCILLMIGNASMGLACLLFAVPISSNTSYFAYGLPAMLLAVTGADIAWPCLTLFTSESLPPEDQALGGALINASGQISRSIGLAITTALQTSIMARERGVPVEHAGKVELWDEPSLTGLRIGNWFNVAISFICVVLTWFAFRGTGIVGKVEKNRERTLAGEAAVDEDNTRKG